MFPKQGIHSNELQRYKNFSKYKKNRIFAELKAHLNERNEP